MPSDILENFTVKKEISEIEEFSKYNREIMDSFFWLEARKNTRINDFGAEPKFEIFRVDQTQNGARGDLPPLRIANIVLQGGGVLGLAHAGFVAGLEKAGVRFAGTAGASAGAIMAMGIAAVRGKELLDPTHERLVRIIGSMPMESFIDGPYRVRWLIKQVLLKKKPYWHPKAWAAVMQALRILLRRRGLNPGAAFEEWLTTMLDDLEIKTIQDIKDNLNEIGRQLREASAANASVKLDLVEEDNAIDLLQIMAACMPLGIKFQFPRDVDVLASSMQHQSPAAFVRASMSIPLFFTPKVFSVNARKWPKFVREKLVELIDSEKLQEFEELDQVAFLDGGIFSNLPADAFRAVMPDVPTIAVPLIQSKAARPFRRTARLSTLAAEARAVAFMVRNQRDYDAIDQMQRARKVYKRRVAKMTSDDERAYLSPSFPFRLAPMDVGDFNWLNFTMNDADMIDLFLVGLRRAKKFVTEDLRTG